LLQVRGVPSSAETHPYRFPRRSPTLLTGRAPSRLVDRGPENPDYASRTGTFVALHADQTCSMSGSDQLGRRRGVIHVKESIKVAGVRLDVVTDGLAAIASLSQGPGPHVVHLLNSYNLALADCDAAYRKLLNASDLNLIDGVPLARLVGSLTGRRAPVVRGPELFVRALSQQAPPLKHYLLGGTDESLRRLLLRFSATADFVGHHAPPFVTRVEEIGILAERVRITEADPDIVWLGLGSPKQDYLAHALAAEGLRQTFVCVGAAFDFASGSVKEAPAWLRGSGFEWMHRLLQDPRRLWRRYLWGNLRFINIALRTLRSTNAGRLR